MGGYIAAVSWLDFHALTATATYPVSGDSARSLLRNSLSGLAGWG